MNFHSFCRSSDMTMAFTGPTAEGTIEMELRPMPIRPMASSGRPPSSPQSVTGFLCFSAFSTIRRMAPSAAGLKGS